MRQVRNGDPRSDWAPVFNLGVQKAEAVTLFRAAGFDPLWWALAIILSKLNYVIGRQGAMLSSMIFIVR